MRYEGCMLRINTFVSWLCDDDLASRVMMKIKKKNKRNSRVTATKADGAIGQSSPRLQRRLGAVKRQINLDALSLEPSVVLGDEHQTLRDTLKLVAEGLSVQKAFFSRAVVPGAAAAAAAGCRGCGARARAIRHALRRLLRRRRRVVAVR